MKKGIVGQIQNLFRKKIRIKNSRRFKRVRVAYLVKYQVNGKKESRITNARDISAGGLRFWTEEAPESSLLDVSIFLPPLNRSVQATAQVLRVRRAREGFVYYVAVSFLDLNQEDRKEIEAFAEAISKDQDARFLIDHADIVVRGQ